MRIGGLALLHADIHARGLDPVDLYGHGYLPSQMFTSAEDAAGFAAIAIGKTRPRMSCLVQESRESKTFPSFLRAMLTHSGLCVLSAGGFRVVSGKVRAAQQN